MTSVGRLFLGVLLLGAAEVYLLVKVAGAVSFLGTLGLCVLTALVGGVLVRRQGLQTLRTIQAALGRGEPPTSEIVAGLALLIAGVLLVVPGFISDAVGFLALVPPLRRRGAAWLSHRLEGRLSHAVFPTQDGGWPPGPSPGPRRGRVIDIEPED